MPTVQLFVAQGKYGIYDYTRSHERDDVLDVKQAVRGFVCQVARVRMCDRGGQCG